METHNFNSIHVSKFWIEISEKSSIIYSELERVRSILNENNINFIIDNPDDYNFIILDYLDKYQFERIESLIFNDEIENTDSQINLFESESENVEDSDFGYEGYDIIDDDNVLFSLDINEFFGFEE